MAFTNFLLKREHLKKLTAADFLPYRAHNVKSFVLWYMKQVHTFCSYHNGQIVYLQVMFSTYFPLKFLHFTCALIPTSQVGFTYILLCILAIVCFEKCMFILCISMSLVLRVRSGLPVFRTSPFLPARFHRPAVRPLEHHFLTKYWFAASQSPLCCLG